MKPSNINHRSGLSINALLFFCFAIIALVPVSLLGFKVYDAAWENAWREVREKHQLLAENLAQPISIYVKAQETTLAITARLLQDLNLSPASSQTTIDSLLEHNMRLTEGLCGMYLLDANQELSVFKTEYPVTAPPAKTLFANANFIKQAVINKKHSVSGIRMNPLNNKPGIYIAMPVYALNNPQQLLHILVGELKIAPIEKLRQGIRFGEAGHSAIVDNHGFVIAHPNPDWMSDEIKDLSKLSVVKQMMVGQTGVTEFYSPFVKQNMVAGFTAVPVLGWGVMVPQPKAEVDAQVHNIVYTQFTWGLLGLLLAIVTAHFLGRWITQPIHELATAGIQLAKQDFNKNLPKIRNSAPTELQLLAGSFSDAISGLAMSRAQVEELNQSLQTKIKEATNELREANTKLSVLARSDHLTSLANRRHFEQTITSLAARRQEDTANMCLLLVDVDHFKDINDKYGHSAGDMALIQIAEILERNMRQTDLAARYAGDEFILLIRADADIGRERAAAIRNEISEKSFIADGDSINVTVSIGLITFNLAACDNQMKDILRKVDDAMYQAKRAGKNTVVEINDTLPQHS
ncbi:sensor domain-containing diguanylate cyclase [Kaarinaea lacus]